MLNRVSSALMKLITPVGGSKDVQKSDSDRNPDGQNPQFERFKPQKEPSDQKAKQTPHLRIVKEDQKAEPVGPEPEKPHEEPHHEEPPPLPNHSSVSNAFIHLLERLKRQKNQIRSWVAASHYQQVKGKRKKKNAYRKGTIVDDTVE